VAKQEVQRSTCTARIILFYKEGCGELWAEKRLRQYFPYVAMAIHSPRLRRIELCVFDRRADEALAALNREAWVAEVALADTAWRRLPPSRQPLHQGFPEKPADMERPFGNLHGPKGGCRGGRRSRRHHR